MCKPKKISTNKMYVVCAVHRRANECALLHEMRMFRFSSECYSFIIVRICVRVCRLTPNSGVSFSVKLKPADGISSLLTVKNCANFPDSNLSHTWHSRFLKFYAQIYARKWFFFQVYYRKIMEISNTPDKKNV